MWLKSIKVSEHYVQETGSLEAWKLRTLSPYFTLLIPSLWLILGYIFF